MNNITELDAAKALCKMLDTKFGQDIVLMDLRELTPIADFFVIATGGSAPQLAALAEAAQDILEANGLTIKHKEGISSANWLLLDFGAIVVHLFDKESREYYNLERTWGDAKLVTFL